MEITYYAPITLLRTCYLPITNLLHTYYAPITLLRTCYGGCAGVTQIFFRYASTVTTRHFDTETRNEA